ncbi:alpha-crystallin A chain-like [Daphnia carinata]|uniref:alpha-crystallin A chain-like n=1 Tax=Daphnia carinata TaxID=120202 RepID=UPI0025803DC0|nr:alpha-crystallin A chain-like [Daphnia carinata]XP_057380258.1 alpha-crystallin A chain-like [Daphnia carinata]
MALTPFTGLDTMLDPFESSDPFDVFEPFESFEPLQTYEPLYEPYRYTRYRHHVRRSRRRTVRTTVRRMDRELGKLVSAIKEDDKSFQVMVDVTDFEPNEITVKTTDKDIIVHAKHDERKDPNGSISREFRRRITIPSGVKQESITSTMSPEGLLTIMAPKTTSEGSNERVIPITMAPVAGAINPPPAQGK